MRNNKGFTLIELIVCLVIFGIIIVSVYGLMITGSQTYETVNGRVNLQMDSQLTMNFINEYLMNCNKAVSSDGSGKLCIIDETSGTYTAYVFQFVDADNTLYFSKSLSVKPNADGSYTCSMGTPEILSDMVDNFLVVPKVTVDGSTTRVNQVDLTLSFLNYSANKICTQTVALRNKPVSALVTVT